MTQFLPPNLLALFAPREPVPYLPPVDKLTHEKKRQPYTGVSEFLYYFEDPEETPPPVHVETKAERLERKRREKAEQVAYKLEQDLAMWDPHHNDRATSDPYKTLFVGRLNYDTSESKLKREFEAYGKIKSIKIVHDKSTSKPRGYAFIEFEDEGGMHAAYKKADGKKIDGRRVVVDIERGRTIEGWKPRRLGGGKGGTRRTATTAAAAVNTHANTMDTFDDFDRVKDRDRERDRGGDRDRERDRDRGDRDRDRDRKRSREKRSRSRSRDRKRRSRSKDRRSKSRERTKKSRRSKSKEKEKHKKRSRSRDRSNKNAVVVDDHHNNGRNGSSNQVEEYMDGDNGY